MKAIASFILTVSICGLVWANTVQQDGTRELEVETDSTLTDSLAYELLIIEPGYDVFLATQPPKNYYSETYYKIWNTRYVLEYNQRYRFGPHRELYENEINYDSHIEYGIDLEYQLYYYFRFFEKKYNVTLVQRGR